jgi:uncharacterized membrane protein
MKVGESEKSSVKGSMKIYSTLVVFVLLVTVFVGMANNGPFELSQNASAEMGGPDSYGYNWYDSNIPSPAIPFNWLEINSTGNATGITGDDSFGTIPLGFGFKFYGNTYTQVNASTNGLIKFNGGSADWTNDPIPSTVDPDNTLALFWSDLESFGGTIYYEMMGIAPDRQLVIQYDDWWTLGGTTGPMKFQAILYESGDILYQYLDLGTATSAFATVGIENINGVDGLQYSYNSAGRITSNLAIRFSTIPPPYLVDITADVESQFDDAGQIVDHIVTVHNMGTSDDTYDLTTSGIWPIVLRDIGDTTDITTLFVTSGTSTDFIARVSIPGGAAIGDYDLSDIMATSQVDTMINASLSALTGVPFSYPWFDDQEFGVFGGTSGMNWSTTDSQYSDVGTQTSKSGSYSLYVNGQHVNVTSFGINTSGLSQVEMRVWVQRGDSAFSEPPDIGEDLRIYYRNDLDNWILLETLAGSGIPGEFFNLKYTLPSDAQHKAFQIRIELVDGDGGGFDFWHMDDVYVGPPIPYDFSLSPGDLEDYDGAGTSVDYIYTINNTGVNNDTYNITFSDNIWAIEIRDIGDTTDITNISVSAGMEKSFIARVSIPPGAIPGDVDFANITVSSEASPLLYVTVMIKTTTIIPVPWLEDFEFGTLGGTSGINWSTSNSNYAGVNDFTSQSGIYSMYTHGNSVSVTSWYVDTRSLSNVEVLCWIRRGADAFSEDPNTGEDLNIFYYNDAGSWILLDTLFGSGTPGEIYKVRYPLSLDAIHENFRLQFSQTGGSGLNMDYWHIDDILIREQPPYDVELSPRNSVGFGTAGTDMDYTITIYNWGSNDDTYNLSSSGSWPVVLRDALDTQDISQVQISPGNSVDIILTVSIPPGAVLGDFEMATITAVSQNDTMVDHTSWATTHIPIIPLWSDDMESGSGKWEIWDDGDGTIWELGNPSSWPYGPNQAVSPSNCWGTNIGGNYTSSGEATLAMPYIDLRSYSNARISFSHWYDINGNGNDGAWVEVTADNGNIWNRINPVGFYPDTDSTGLSCYAGSSGGWLLAEFDLSGYFGSIVQVRFHFYDYSLDTQERAGWYIDDLSLALASGGSTANATGPVGGPSGVGSITITYTTTGSPFSVDLYYTTDSAQPYTWTLIGTDSPADGFYMWTITSDGSYGWIAKSNEELAPTTSDAPEASYYIFDVNPPEIIKTIPAAGAINVYMNQFIVVRFSEPMNNNTLTFTCSPDPGGWSMVWNEENDEATLLHANFDFSQLYTFQVTDAQDMVGNSLVSGSTPNPWNFTTEASDTRPPAVFSTLPEGSDVLTDDIIIIAFNETMDTTSVESAFTYTDGSATWSIVNGAVLWNSPTNNRLSFNPTADFDYSLTYTVTIDSDLARDVNGNYLDGNKNGIAEGGPLDDHFWSFTIQDMPDQTPPVSEIVALDPYQDSPTFNIPWNATDDTGIHYVELYYTTDGGSSWTKYGSFYFTSPIQFSAVGEGEYGFYSVATDNSTNFNREAGPFPGTIPDKSTIVDSIPPSVDAGGNKHTNVQTTLFPTVSDSGSGIDNITWIVQSSPSSGTITWSNRYSQNVTVSADEPGTYVLRLIITDRAGNVAFDEINLVWDATAPIATGSPDWDPVSIFNNVIITFSEAMINLSVENAFSISPLVTGSFSWNAQGTQMTFDPDNWFNSNTTYTVTLDSAGVFDLAGNEMENDLSWSFTTGSSVTNNIMGQVVDMNGYSISGATVRIDGTDFRTTTDENGEYLIRNVPVGDYTLVVEKSGFKTREIAVKLEPHSPTVAPQIALERKEDEFNPLWIILAIVIIVIVILLLIILIGRSQKNRKPSYSDSQQTTSSYPPPPPIGEGIYPYGAPPPEGTSPYQPPGEAPQPDQIPQDVLPLSEEEVHDAPPSEEHATDTTPSEEPPSEERTVKESPQVVPMVPREGAKESSDMKLCVNCNQPMPMDTTICPYCSWDQEKPLPPPPPQYM